ncbi:MAG: hypothetical protein H0X16_12340 [Chloroflexi bacterium]|nr:hypothetical protein [Chloroflexota bacterium]
MRRLRPLRGRLPLRRPTTSSLPIHPLLFGAYAILFLYSQNLAHADLDDVLPILGRVLLLVTVALLVAVVAFRDAGIAAIVVSAGVIAFFGYGHAAGLIAPRQIEATHQQAAWIAFIGLCFLFAVLIGRHRRQAMTVLNTVSMALVLVTLIQIVPHDWTRLAQAAAADTRQASITGAAQGPVRDIYYLIFDRYGSDNALKVGYGIENDLPEWLAQKGFHVAPLSHANYVRTTLSLAGTLNMDYWNELEQQVGRNSLDYGPLHRLIQDHAVGRFLKEQGYRYYHLGSWFEPTRTIKIADVNTLWGSEPEFETALFETTALPVLEKAFADEPAVLTGFDYRHRENALFQFRELARLRNEPGPKFVTGHVLLPHDPYIFDAEGRVVPKEVRETGDIQRRDPKRFFEPQLRYTNTRIRELIEPLLALPEDKRPIIVIQADEGPYPPRYFDPELDWARASVAELEMKFGILNAMYLPGLEGVAEESAVYPAISSVNTFRLIFSAYFGADLPMLPDRSFISRTKAYPYALTEITDQLPTLTGGPLPEGGVPPMETKDQRPDEVPE